MDRVRDRVRDRDMGKGRDRVRLRGLAIADPKRLNLAYPLLGLSNLLRVRPNYTIYAVHIFHRAVFNQLTLING